MTEPEQQSLFDGITCLQCRRGQPHDCAHPAGYVNYPHFEVGRFYRTLKGGEVVKIVEAFSVYTNLARDPRAPSWRYIYRVQNVQTGFLEEFREHALLQQVCPRPVRKPRRGFFRDFKNGST